MSNVSLSLLSIRKKRREGYPCTFEYGDLLIDGLRLYDRVLQQYSNLDDISCLGFGAEAFQRKQIEKLLLNGNPDFPNDRRALYICPGCADLGCGAVSLRITRENGIFVWQDFGCENAGGPDPGVTPLPGIGPFYFEEKEYTRTIRSAYGLGGFHWPAPAE